MDEHGDHAADIERLISTIPPSMRVARGAAPYTGLASWLGSAPLYVLGLNPGGDPSTDASTVEESTRWVLGRWHYSAYVSGEWSPRGPGMHSMQRSLLLVLGQLGLDPNLVPGSNVIYARSRQAHHIAADEKLAYAEACWPWHAATIERQDVRVVLAMGGEAASFVRNKVGAHTLASTFTEGNKRGNKSYLWVGDGVSVVQAPHPSRFPWDSPGCDITPLVQEALARG